MSNILKGVVAGFVATVVLSILMVIKAQMGLLPAMNAIKMLTNMAGADSMMVGWVAHFAIGSIAWGGLFALLYSSLPGNSAIAKAVVLSIGAWLLMMIVVMPMAGAGLFGMNIGMMAPVMTLVLHIIFGIVMGAVYRGEAPANTAD